ncbi:MAG: flagellar basal body rod protein FlgC [Desulfatirhabdiaceae bacterium]
MNFFEAIHSSSSGLSAQRVRMNLISSNLANSQTTKTAEGGPYQKKMAVFATKSSDGSFREIMNSEISARPSEVKVTEVINDQKKPILKYDPLHPDADNRGFVSMPNINVMEEMVDMLSAARSYEANITAISTSKNMVQKALEIGR